jgi:pyruvyltransferase
MFFGVNNIKKLEKQCVYWWEPKDGSVNMGDYLSRVIVSEVLSLRDREIVEKIDKSKRLFAIGSVLHFAKTGETVWGAGINWKINPKEHKFGNLDVRAVRGPLTRDYLIHRGIDVPEVYGDPALLTPLFLPAKLLCASDYATEPYLVVPHMNEPPDKFNSFKEKIISPKCKPAEFIAQMLRAKLIISSSLHGIILAEAYGIPAVYLDMGNGEAIGKYDDYYQGTGRTTYRTVRTVGEGIEVGGNATFDLESIQSRLLKAFPWGHWI